MGFEGEQGRGGTGERLEKGREEEEQGRPGGGRRSTGGVKPGRGRISDGGLHLLRRGDRKSVV